MYIHIYIYIYITRGGAPIEATSAPGHSAECALSMRPRA